MLGKHYLCAVVTQEGNAPSVWKTPQATDGEGGVMQIREGADGKYKLRDYAAKWHGLLDPEKPSTNGSRQGSLNPRWVETLQGIPVGWVMPSCASPVTPVLMSCDSSETESACPPESEPFEL